MHNRVYGPTCRYALPNYTVLQTAMRYQLAVSSSQSSMATTLGVLSAKAKYVPPSVL